MAECIDVLNSKLQRVFAKDLADIVAQAQGAAGVIPRFKRSVHAEAGATIGRIAAPDDDARKLASGSVVEQMARRELLSVQTSPAEGDSLAGYIHEYDSLPCNSKGENIEEGGRDHRGHLRLRSDAGTRHTIENGREAVGLVRPLWNRSGGLPVIVDAAEQHFRVGAEVVVDLQQLFSPVGRQRDGGDVTRADAGVTPGGGVGSRDQAGLQHRGGIGIYEKPVVDEGQTGSRERTVGKLFGVQCPAPNRTDIAEIGYVGISLVQQVVAAFGVGGDSLAELGWAAFPPKLLREEEKRLILLGVVQVGDEERAAVGPPIIISAVER